MPAGIRLEEVTKRFGNRDAVQNLDLVVEPGKRLALLGPSGCGKTTTLRMIAGVEAPDAGRIVIGETVVNDPRSRVSPAKRGVGMVFQSLALWPHMTVEKNLRFAGGGEKDPGTVPEALALVGLKGREKAYPHELSGGEQQRVALARALVTEPGVLLLDEPMANLDAGLKRDLIESIRAIQETLEVTMIYVTHDQFEALSIGETIGVMKDGTLRQIGPPAEVYYEPSEEFVAMFLGRNNVLEGVLENGTLRCPAGTFAVADPPDAGTVRVSLRAEDLSVQEDDGGPLTVKASVFAAGRYLMELEAGGVTVTAESREPLEAGSKVSLEALRPARVLR